MSALKIWDKEIELDLNRTDKCFVGSNGSGKTTLLNSIANHLDNMNISCVRYDAITTLQEF